MSAWCFYKSNEKRSHSHIKYFSTQPLFFAIQGADIPNQTATATSPAQAKTDSGEPAGAFESAGIYYLATASTLYLYQADGQLLEKLERASLPGLHIVALGKADDKIVLKTATAIVATGDGSSWKAGNTGKVEALTVLLPRFEAEMAAVDKYLGSL